jgi:class 3 adenylate cyclase
VDGDANGDHPGTDDDVAAPAGNTPARGGPAGWFQNVNRNPDVVSLIRLARKKLPGDPDFGDPLSRSGDGGAQAAARAADRLLPDREAATREVSLATLQVWQALTQRVSGRPVDAEVTIVFTDLVGFSDWSLHAGDEATLRLLRRVAQVAEPPLLDAGGHIVKRMGDGMMVVFSDPLTAVRATIAARDAVKTVEVDGYTPRIRAGIHTGRPQRIGGDWLGVDVNIAARVMDRATRGGLIVSEATLAAIPPHELELLGTTVKRVRRQVFSPRQAGVPADLEMYRLTTRRAAPGENSPGDHGAASAVDAD